MKGERWYGDGLRFQCRQCGSCCTGAPGFVWVTERETKSLAAMLQMSLQEFTDKYLRRVGGRVSLKERANGDCFLFQDKKCLVYQSRPRQCRTYPFWKECLSSEQHWDLYVRDCPGAGHGRLYEAEEIERIVSGGETISG